MLVEPNLEKRTEGEQRRRRDENGEVDWNALGH
jgi:hypothetical protein